MRIQEQPEPEPEDEVAADCACPTCHTLELLARRWTPHVLEELAGSRRLRFNELKRRLEGISPRTLSDRLSQLTEAGLVERTDHGETPPRVDYELTEAGHELGEALEDLVHWTEEHG